MLQPTQYELWIECVFRYWDMEYGDLPLPNLEYDSNMVIVEKAFREKVSPQTICGQLRDVIFWAVK